MHCRTVSCDKANIALHAGALTGKSHLVLDATAFRGQEWGGPLCWVLGAFPNRPSPCTRCWALTMQAQFAVRTLHLLFCMLVPHRRHPPGAPCWAPSSPFPPGFLLVGQDLARAHLASEFHSLNDLYAGSIHLALCAGPASSPSWLRS